MFGIVTILKQAQRNVQLPADFDFHLFLSWCTWGFIGMFGVGIDPFLDHPVGLVWLVGLMATMLYMDEP